MLQLKDLTNILLNTLFPIPCHICGQLVDCYTDGVACKSCWQKLLPFVEHSSCLRCSYPVTLAADYAPPPDCLRCRKLIFQSARAIGRYEGALRAEILHLKKYPTISQRLTQLIQQHFKFADIDAQHTLLMPVPLHPDREQARGFNQSEIIAQRLAQISGLKIDNVSLIRYKSTAKHRAGMDFNARTVSVAQAFKIVRPRLIANQQIILIDDILTTGSTVSACASTLLAAGATSVNVFTLARVVSSAH